MSLPVTAAELLARWQSVRNRYKLDGITLNAAQLAGLLIEELGSAYAALRLVQVHQDAPLILQLARPATGDWNEVRHLLAKAWLGESSCVVPTVDELLQAWYSHPGQADSMAECQDARVLAGAWLASYDGKLETAIQALGQSLYSSHHQALGLARHRLAREALFWLEMARVVTLLKMEG